MLEKYIDRKLARKNIGVYFKKGKWVLHVIFLLLMLVINAKKLQPEGVDMSGRDLLLSLVMLLPFVVFFYIYCLYLIPVFFKRNRQKRFWMILLVLMSVFPALEGLLSIFFSRYNVALTASVGKGTWLFLLKSYRDFWINFIGFTSLLYFMELLEGIRTLREISLNKSQLAFTELHMIKTKMNPEFMVRSLDGIIDLANKEEDATPDAVIRFSDVLRYRLYRSKAGLVPLGEELQQLESLFGFHNEISRSTGCTLEAEGDAGNRSIPPLALINIAEPLINTWGDAQEPHLLMYLLIEETELQIAVEFSTTAGGIDTVISDIRNNLNLIFGRDVIFAMEKEHNNYSIRICLPLQHSSNALL